MANEDIKIKREKKSSKKHKKDKKRRRREIDEANLNDDHSSSSSNGTGSKKEKKKKKKKSRDDEERNKRQRKEPPPSENRNNKSATTTTTTVVSTFSPINLTTTPRPDANTTPYRQKTLQFEVSLPPHRLSNIQESLTKSIRSLLLKYDDGMEGVLLAYWDVQLKNKVGTILNELPHVHFVVTAQGLVFCPAFGMMLSGVVNECFPSHVGLLVNSYFNAMVSSQCLRNSGYEYNMNTSEWKKGGDNIIRNNEEMTFEVKKVNECAGLISLEGEI